MGYFLALLRLLELVFLNGVLAFAQQDNAVSLRPNVSVAEAADSISIVLSSSFAGLGIEFSNLFSFTGGVTPNNLSINLLTNLANYTGVPPHFRIGGNSQDTSIWDPTYMDYGLRTNPNPSGAGLISSSLYSFGPRFVEALNRFPANTPITWGLSLSYEESDYIDNIVATAEAARSGLTNVNLASFEIGNEPDLYNKNGFRQGPWNSQRYAQEWRTRADAVYQQVLRPHNISSNFFESTCTSSTIGTSFEIVQMAEQTSILQPANNTLYNASQGYIAAWNQHDYYYYISISAYNLELDMLMDLSTTDAQFASWKTQVQQAHASGYPYVLREMASVGPVGAADISDAFGATLWTLNFFLYAATLNISSVQMHMTDNSFASPWQPTDIYGLIPGVRTTYYAFAAMDQLIGGGCTTRVSPMPISQFPSAYENRLQAYATYQQGTVAAFVLLNTKMANVSQTDKGSASFNLMLPSLAGQTLYLSYLTADGADSKNGTVWNGISYEQSSDGTPTVVNRTVQTMDVGPDGSISVSVRDTQAIVANIGGQIGTGPPSQYNDTACRALAGNEQVPRPDTVEVGGTTSARTSSGPRSTDTGNSGGIGGSSSSSSKGHGSNVLISGNMRTVQWIGTFLGLVLGYA